MVKAQFAHVRAWVFDLDNTLYPPEVRLFDQIEVKMRRYVMDALGVDEAEADALRLSYWRKHGTTLAGLMEAHQIDADHFMEDVHDISFDALEHDPELREWISALPGRKIVYTNGSRPYAQKVIEHRGLNGLFEAVYGVEHASYRPKPHHAAFEEVFARANLDTTKAAMFEDEARNLEAPFTMGMRTVHVAPAPEIQPYIQHHTDNLSGFLKQVLG